MNTKLAKFLAPLALGCGLVVGMGTAAEAHHKHSNHHYSHHYNHGGHHQAAPRRVRVRSLKVTPRYHIPSPADYSHRRRNSHHDYVGQRHHQSNRHYNHADCNGSSHRGHSNYNYGHSGSRRVHKGQNHRYNQHNRNVRLIFSY